MKNPFKKPRRPATVEQNLVLETESDRQSRDNAPEEWYAIPHQLLTPPETRATMYALVETEVDRLVRAGALDEAHAGVLDHLIEDRRRELEAHVNQTYHHRTATQANVTKRAQGNEIRASLTLRELRAGHREAVEARNYNRDLLLGDAAPPSLAGRHDVDGAPRPATIPMPEVDASHLHGSRREKD
ncbi:hypothetical protein [Ruania rhizosphaerae]|uniref:hypothetical protein n=1 Tax=Ruania rhizosphaerae TaxID=1840413 RepID=UPI0013587EFD|nr:hypothetical protein [Ruania rhizosphaerae]